MYFLFRNIFFFLLSAFFSLQSTFAAGSVPEIKCDGLPGCTDSPSYNATGVITKVVDEFIQIVIVVAVFSLIFWGILYIISWGEDEKVSKAKKWILWSLAGVILASSAWGIIRLLNTINVNF